MLSIKVISYLVYLIWIFMSGSAHAVCVEGWTPDKDKCYHFSDDTKTHAEAIKACEDIGGILASVANKDVNDFLWNNKPFGQEEPFHWIGLVADTDWYWNDGSKADNVVVVNSEPDSVCAKVTSDSVFSSTTCTDSMGYICVSSIMRTGWKEHNGMWYYISSEHLVDVVTNMVAMENCWNMTTTLAFIDNVSGLSLIVDTSGYWIGLSKLHWLDDSPFHWHNWKHHEKGPIGGQPCMTLHPTNNKWEAQPCDGANRYICQKGLHITTTTTSTTTTVTTTVTTSTTNTTSTATTSSRKPTTSLKPVSTKQTSGTDGSAGNPTTPTGQTATDITEGLTTAAGTKGEISARFGSIDETMMYIIIGVICGVVVLVILFVLMCCLSKRREEKDGLQTNNHHQTTVDNEYDYANVSPTAHVQAEAAEPYSYASVHEGGVQMNEMKSQKIDDRMTAVPVYSGADGTDKIHDDAIPVACATPGLMTGTVENSTDITTTEHSTMPVYYVPDKSKSQSNKQSGLASTENFPVNTNISSTMPVYSVPDKTRTNSNTQPVQPHVHDVYATVDKSKKSSNKNSESVDTTLKRQENA